MPHAATGTTGSAFPLTILEAPADAEMLVLEVGTSEPGEIGLLTSIAEPDHAVVTTVSEAHLTGLGSLAGVPGRKAGSHPRRGGLRDRGRGR